MIWSAARLSSYSSCAPGVGTKRPPRRSNNIRPVRSSALRVIILILLQLTRNVVTSLASVDDSTLLRTGGDAQVTVVVLSKLCVVALKQGDNVCRDCSKSFVTI